MDDNLGLAFSLRCGSPPTLAAGPSDVLFASYFLIVLKSHSVLSKEALVDNKQEGKNDRLSDCESTAAAASSVSLPMASTASTMTATAISMEFSLLMSSWVRPIRAHHVGVVLCGPGWVFASPAVLLVVIVSVFSSDVFDHSSLPEQSSAKKDKYDKDNTAFDLFSENPLWLPAAPNAAHSHCTEGNTTVSFEENQPANVLEGII